jgi:hypothetical protein
MSKRTPNQILAVIIGLISIISVLIILISYNRNAIEFEANSPEGVTQAYLNSVFDGDYDRAVTFLEADSKCDASDLDRTYVNRTVRINLSSVDTTDGSARVKIRLEYSNGAPFDSSYSEEQTIRLITEDNSWKITGIPWPMYDCGLFVR